MNNCIDAQVVFGGVAGKKEFERKFYYDTNSLIIYCGFAEKGSSETDAVWTISQISTNTQGDVLSVEKFFNQKWEIVTD